jgi:hypothetical protein
MFNSRDYEWADASLILAGADVIGLRGVKYKSKIDREPLYAKGREPHSIQSGNKSYEGEITVTLAEYLKMPSDLLQLKALTASVSFGNPSEGMPMQTKTIMGIYFTESGPEAKQGDKVMEVTLPFIAMKIV